jgi:3-deoxy-manno-octulosonate cytidylyltransferase (CMP-KDO synthetase)
MKAIGIIPARYASTRFPAKPLCNVFGKTMIQRVWEGATAAHVLERVLVATDHECIAEVCAAFGAEVVMTAPELPSGTDRVAAAYQQHVAACKEEYDIVVNIQGDEPLLKGSVIDRLVETLEGSKADVSTPIQRLTNPQELVDSAIVKVVLNNNHMALYFSRSPIPCVRDVAPSEEMYAEWLRRGQFWKHIGLYAYRTEALLRFQKIPPSPLELSEQLEQLRLLQDGLLYVCVETSEHFVAIDTPEDVERVVALLRSQSRS